MPFWMGAIGGYTELATPHPRAWGWRRCRSTSCSASPGSCRSATPPISASAPMARRWRSNISAPARCRPSRSASLVATLAAAIIGALIVRRRGVYFAMVTIAFGQVFYFLAFRWNSVTGGDDGLTGWHRHADRLRLRHARHLRQRQGVLLFRAGDFRASASPRWRCCSLRPSGARCVAIRENERRARFLGVPIELHIWLSFVISCLFVSVAGALYALLNNFTDPRALRFDLSGNLVIMAVLGGMRSFWGPLIGAAIFVALQDFVSSRTENWMSVIGLVFVLVVRFFPRGVLGHAAQRGHGMSLLQVERRLEALRQPRRDRRRVADHRTGRTARDHRPERRRQDDVLQSRQRPLCADVRARSCSKAATSPRSRPRSGSRAAWRARSRSPRSFPNFRSPTTSASRSRSRPAIG